MAKSLNLRVAAAAAAALIPPAVLLAVMAGNGAASWTEFAVAVGLGIIGGGCVTLLAGRWWSRHAERLAAIAGALEKGVPPAHLLPVGGDPILRAERRLLEAADSAVAELNLLEGQRDEFDAILRSMTEAVVVTGARGEVVMLNGAARRMFALEAEGEYAGRDFVELCRDPRLQEFVTRATRSPGGEVVSAEFAIQNPAPRHLGANAAPVRQSRGRAAAWVVVFHDITQLKAYETVRADFVANLTHELRTPLSALRGYAETLLGGVDDPASARRFLEIIESQSRRLARLLDDLISLSDLERGLTPLKFERLQPGRVIGEAAELMAGAARSRGVALEADGPGGAPAVSGDHDRLQQVLLNLLDNAIKYTPRGGRVTVAARPVESGDGGAAAQGVEFIVSDSGEGIPPADVPRLTERFYRVDRARSRELGGTGLGLAIVKHIVQLHHGRLKIESRLREGTSVTVWLPAAEPGSV